MSEIEIIALNFQYIHLLNKISLPIASILKSPITMRVEEVDLERFYNHERAQYDAGQILQSCESGITAEKGILFTSVDLFIPIFTYVFGLAKLNGRLAIVSSLRLMNQFYGLPKNEKLLEERLIKEAVHEYGHLCNLRHCDNYQCVMASSNTADDLDTKGIHFCPKCEPLI